MRSLKSLARKVAENCGYSCSVALYDYFNENAILSEHLKWYPARELVEDF